MNARKQLGLFGGTFNPVHCGHVQSARELKQLLQLDELRLLPCHQPPHRDTPEVSSEQRLAMVELAISDEPGLVVDDRELQRDGPSYTVDTLASLRQELGDEASLYWVMGTDAFAGLANWHRWQALLDYAHIVVMARPDAGMPSSGEVATLLAERRVLNPDQLRAQAAGHILLVSLTAYPISATDIRRRLASGEPTVQLLPRAVANYIEQHQLYR
jgi:nicotinate-nucleotide adenylyltransferase